MAVGVQQFPPQPIMPFFWNSSLPTQQSPCRCTIKIAAAYHVVPDQAFLD